MARYKLTLAYDGTEFEGWQAQAPGHRTVQAELEAALSEIAGRAVRVEGAGRTDAGVHALGQVASTWLETRLAPEVLRRALNAKLPPDAAVLRVEAVPAAFHARYHARAKLYRYALWNGPERAPLRARTHHHVPEPLDLAAMEAAAGALAGTHDFAAFQAAGSGVEDTVRTLHRVSLSGVAGHALALEVLGSGFLRHMVRNLVGTLLEVGRGRRAPGSLGALLAGRDRTAAGPTAPARGLILVRVLYGPPREVAGAPGSAPTVVAPGAGNARGRHRGPGATDDSGGAPGS